MFELDHIAVGDNIFFAFGAEFALLAGFGISAGIQQIFPKNNFCFHKFVAKIRMYGAPAIGAVSPLFIVQALVSSSPVVKNVIKFSNSYDFLIKISVSDSSGEPISALSSSDKPSNSYSVCTSICKHREFVNKLPVFAKSSGLPFSKYNLGLNVSN